jgi:hypothetical protein
MHHRRCFPSFCICWAVLLMLSQFTMHGILCTVAGRASRMKKMCLLMLLPPSKIAYTMYTYLLQFSVLCFCDADTCTNILLRKLLNSAFSIVLHSAYTILKRRSYKHYRRQWDLYLCSMSNVLHVVYVRVHLMKYQCVFWTGLALCAVQFTLKPCLDNVSFQ